MKKLILAALTTTSILAGTTATLNLKGTVGQVVDIAIAHEAVASSLDLTANASDLLVATLTENSNSQTGYTVSVTSANGGNLDNSGNLFPYSLKYGTQSVDLVNGDSFDGATGLVTNNQVELKVSYTGQAASTMVSGDYTDDVTFTIAAK